MKRKRAITVEQVKFLMKIWEKEIMRLKRKYDNTDDEIYRIKIDIIYEMLTDVERYIFNETKTKDNFNMKTIKKGIRGVRTQKQICLLLDDDLQEWLGLFNNRNRTINDAIRKAKNEWESRIEESFKKEEGE